MKPAAAVAQVEAIGDFKADYRKFCDALQVVPHPQILPFYVAPPIDENAEPEPEPEKPPPKGKKAPEPEPEPESDPIYNMDEVDSIAVKDWKLDAGSLTAMCLALPKCQTVLSLNLCNTGLSAAQIRLLGSALPSTTVKSIRLEWNVIAPAPDFEEQGEEPEDETDCYAALCSKDNKLTTLSFRGNGITDKGAEAIALELRMNYRLDSLNLFCNRIGDVGGCALAVALRFNGSIATLSIGSNSVTATTAIAFAESLTRYKLTSQQVAERKEIEEQLAAMKKAADESAKKAKKGKKDKNAVGEPGPNELPPVEEVDGELFGNGNKKLQKLNLSSNGISDLGANQMGAMLQEYLEGVAESFKWLNVQRNEEMTEETAELLQSLEPVQVVA